MDDAVTGTGTDPVTKTRPHIDVGPAADLEAYVRTDDIAWSGEAASIAVEQHLVGLPADQRFAARIDGSAPGTYPGIYGVRPMTLSVPGAVPGSGRPDDAVRRVPAAGLTWVSVHPDHRRQGVLTAMIGHHFEQARVPSPAGTGWAVSVLHASEPGIYGRYGYGSASLEMSVDLGRGSAFTAPHLEQAAAGVRTELAAVTDAAMPQRLLACWQRCGSHSVGTVVGELGFYTALCEEPVSETRGKEVKRVLFARRDGEDVGMAIFRREPNWERGRPGGKLDATWLVGEPATKLALLRRLVDFDLMGTTKVWTLGADDPVLHWVAGPRGAADVSLYDSLWVRLIDLPAALSARGYAATCDLLLDVTDDQLPENAGLWHFVVDATGAATITRPDENAGKNAGESAGKNADENADEGAPDGADDGADLRLSIAALGSTYLGGVSPVTLADAGLIQELRIGAAREFSATVCTPDRPVAAIEF